MSRGRFSHMADAFAYGWKHARASQVPERPFIHSARMAEMVSATRLGLTLAQIANAIDTTCTEKKS